MRYLLIILLMFGSIPVLAQLAGTFTYDQDSNYIYLQEGDTQYVQQAYKKNGLETFGDNTLFINTDEEYKYSPHFRGSLAEIHPEEHTLPERSTGKGYRRYGDPYVQRR